MNHVFEIYLVEDVHMRAGFALHTWSLYLKSILASDPLPIYPISFRQFVYNIPETPNSKQKTKKMMDEWLFQRGD